MQALDATVNGAETGLMLRKAELFEESSNAIHKRADRLFAHLMIVQWLAGIAAAVWISPHTWIGATSQIHWHVWAAVFLGGAITSLPVFLAWKQPGQTLTRHVIAVGQMLSSALLIHLTGGRLETHFHIFGSLAFMAFYRDWRVLLTATVVVALDHLARGLFWPQVRGVGWNTQAGCCLRTYFCSSPSDTVYGIWRTRLCVARSWRRSTLASSFKWPIAPQS